MLPRLVDVVRQRLSSRDAASSVLTEAMFHTVVVIRLVFSPGYRKMRALAFACFVVPKGISGNNRNRVIRKGKRLGAVIDEWRGRSIRARHLAQGGGRRAASPCSPRPASARGSGSRRSRRVPRRPCASYRAPIAGRAEKGSERAGTHRLSPLIYLPISRCA